MLTMSQQNLYFLPAISLGFFNNFHGKFDLEVENSIDVNDLVHFKKCGENVETQAKIEKKCGKIQKSEPFGEKPNNDGND